MLSNFDIYFDWLKADPLNFASYLITMIVTFVMSLVLHECAHGYMALRCGDPTAKMLGRLSLNPLRHLDPIGTICMFLFGFGWAKPVPVNPRNFQNYRRDDFLVSIAGVATNLTIFIICSLLAVLLNLGIWKTDMLPLLDIVYGGASGAGDMVNIFSNQGDPIVLYIVYGQSYDWLEPFINTPVLLYVQRALLMLADVNLLLAIFNLIPLPPLDGFHVLNDTLLGGKLQLNTQMYYVAKGILFILLYSTNFVGTLLNKGSELIGGSVIRMFLMLTGQM